MLRRREKERKLEEKKGFSPLIKIFFVSFLLIFYITTVFAEEFEEIDSLEENIFHKKFTHDSKEERVSRLENLLFGTQYENQNIEKRISKITAAIQPSQKEKPQSAQTPTPPSQSTLEAEPIQKTPKIVYDESPNSGITGIISQLENKVFNRTFNELQFSNRIDNLEEKLLSVSEIKKIRKKTLIERVTFLIKKGNLQPSPQTQRTQNLNTQANFPPQQNYTIDPRTGILINEQTGQAVLDNFRNPIKVKVPQPIYQQPLQQAYPNQLPQNQFNPINPYGNNLQQGGLPGQIPLDLLFNQGGFDPGDEQGY